MRRLVKSSIYPLAGILQLSGFKDSQPKISKFVQLQTAGVSEYQFGHVPLDEPFTQPKVSSSKEESVVILKSTSNYEAKVRKSVLDNGVTIISHQKGDAQVSLGVYAPCVCV